MVFFLSFYFHHLPWESCWPQELENGRGSYREFGLICGMRLSRFG
jgi:hypothetical protein